MDAWLTYLPKNVKRRGRNTMVKRLRAEYRERLVLFCYERMDKADSLHRADYWEARARHLINGSK